MCKNGHKKENGMKKTSYEKKQRRPGYNKERYKDNRRGQCERQTGQDNTYVPPSPLNAETVKREDIMKRGAVYLKEYNMWTKQRHQRKKIIEITTKSRE